MAAGKIFWKRLSARHTIERVHGSQGDLVSARILQDMLQDVGHGGSVCVIGPTARVCRRHGSGEVMIRRHNTEDMRRFDLKLTSKQRRKAWGTNNVEKGMLGLGEGAQGLEEVAFGGR